MSVDVAEICDLLVDPEVVDSILNVWDEALGRSGMDEDIVDVPKCLVAAGVWVKESSLGVKTLLEGPSVSLQDPRAKLLWKL